MGLLIENLRISLRGQCLAALSTHVQKGQITTIMGPSGAGKSTLLAALIGAAGPAFTITGKVVLNGRDITALPIQHRRIGLLFQDDVLFPHLSVGGNLAFGLPPAPKADRQAKIASALASAGLEGFADRDPATLSGGQRARVALLRSLLAEPLALLLDEPFSRLDAALRDQIRSFVFATARAQNLPVILVTHDESDARAAGGPVMSPMGAPLVLAP